MASSTERLPGWFKIKLPPSKTLRDVEGVLERHGLATVCQEALCPNRAECFGRSKTATFMILGKSCTRNCTFCAVGRGDPEPIDAGEPARLAAAVSEFGLEYVVVTSVTRDDLPDGGAGQFAAVIRELRETTDARIEVLIPDFLGDRGALETVVSAGPDVLNHNMETARRLYPAVRPMADYDRSLILLSRVKEISPETYTKSGVMVGCGETDDEVFAVMDDLRSVGCDMMTIGQYLRPREDNLEVARYVTPDEFESYRSVALDKGFRAVASGPLVRSSYRARELFE